MIFLQKLADQYSNYIKGRKARDSVKLAQFISYPKSGRTWIRYILHELGIAESIAFHHDRFEFKDGSCPPHDFNLDVRLEKYTESEKVIYLERDPRDVMVSLYHQITGRFADCFNYSGSLSEFIRDPYFGAENLHRFRKIWSEIITERSFLKIEYEQMQHDPVKTIEAITEYLEMPRDGSHIQQAVSAGGIEKMKQVEESETFSKPWLRPRNGFRKVRKGKMGGYLEELDKTDIHYLNNMFFGESIEQ